MSPILFFTFFFTCPGMGKIFLQINSAAVAFINILIAAWEGLILLCLFVHIIMLKILKWSIYYFTWILLLEILHFLALIDQ